MVEETLSLKVGAQVMLVKVRAVELRDTNSLRSTCAESG